MPVYATFAAMIVTVIKLNQIFIFVYFAAIKLHPRPETPRMELCQNSTHLKSAMLIIQPREFSLKIVSNVQC